MIIELGHYALVLALATVIVQSVLPLIGTIRNDRSLMAVAPAAALAGFMLVLFSFVVLTFAYVVSDFSVANVWENSHSLKPMIYKISGVWGNHEGSMLLWLLILVFFSALVATFGANLLCCPAHDGVHGRPPPDQIANEVHGPHRGYAAGHRHYNRLSR